MDFAGVAYNPAMGRPVSSAVVLATLLAVPSALLAQPRAPAPTPGAAALVRGADAHYRLGTRLYGEQAYAAAAAEFRAALAENAAPELNYNLGMSLEAAGDLSAARDAFEAYNRAVPAAPNRDAVRERILTLQERIAAARVTAPAPATSSAAGRTPISPAAPTVATGRSSTVVDPVALPPVEHRGAPMPPAPAWVLMGTGAAVLITSGVLAALSQGALADCSVQGDTARCPTQDALDRARQAPGLTLAANVSLGVGIASLAGGLAWWALAPRRSVTVGVSPSGVVLAGRW